MRTRATMTISLPRQMIQEVERVRKREHRTRSELLREALRLYMSRARSFPVYTPTRPELREIEKGRADLRRGQSYTIDELFHALASLRRKARTKSHRPRA